MMTRSATTTLRELGRGYFLQGRYEQCGVIFMFLCDHDPDSCIDHAWRGLNLLAQGDWHPAIALCQSQLQRARSHGAVQLRPYWQLALALAQSKIGNIEQAQTGFERYVTQINLLTVDNEGET